VKSFRQHVLEIAAQKLLSSKCHRFPALGLRFLIAEGNLAVFQREDAAVRAWV
jgi:hypothetical protein